MKKLTALCVAVLSLAAQAASAEVHGTAQFSTSHADYSGTTPGASIQSLDTLLDVAKGTRLGLSVTNVDAFNDNARVFGVRVSRELTSDISVDASLAASDQGKITIHRRGSAMVKYKALPAKNLILGVGVDAYDMRDGGSSTSLVTEGVYYVPGVPLVVQGNVVLGQSSVNDRDSYRVGVAATYGKVGNWTASARYETGRVHYELLRFPGAVADYNSKSFGVGLNYWLGSDWGVSGNLSRVDNRYFQRDELRVGVFWSF